jgi:pyruvate kinase
MLGLMQAGMDVARINFSHSSRDTARDTVRRLRALAQEREHVVAVLGDLQGPRLRLGEVQEGVVLREGDKFILSTRPVVGNEREAFVDYALLPQDVHPGDTILIDDGLLQMKVLSTSDTEVTCEVVVGGPLRSHKGINVPSATLRVPSLTDKDKDDLRTCVEEEFEFVALSFVRNAADVLRAKDLIRQLGGNSKVIAKIEKHEAVANYREILDVADGIMVARGDLGVEMPPEEVPLIQKRLIKAANELGKPVITATQMLNSMIGNPRPTRAEASDVANAILDGTDAVMLSGETAIGRYPVEATKMMARIALATEAQFDHRNWLRRAAEGRAPTITEAVTLTTCEVAHSLKAAAIVASTYSGYTARMVAKLRPEAPVLAVTDQPSTFRQLALTWGVRPVLWPRVNDTDEMMAAATEAALRSGLAQPGDVLVITAGLPIGVPGYTNMMRVQVVGNVLATGQGLGTTTVSGTVLLVTPGNEPQAPIEGNFILVARRVDPQMETLLDSALALVTEEEGLTSYGALRAVERGLPAVVGVPRATQILRQGIMVTVDASRGVIYEGPRLQSFGEGRQQ